MIRCNNCYWRGRDDEDLYFFEDKSFPENSFSGCPKCETDEYLMDIEDKKVETPYGDYSEAELKKKGVEIL